MRKIVFALAIFIVTIASAQGQYYQQRRAYPVAEECPQGRQIRAQKPYPSTMTDCEVLDADTAAENQKLRRKPSPPPSAQSYPRQPLPNGSTPPAAIEPPPAPVPPKIDIAKQRIDDDLKLGYPTVTFEDFALDNKTMVEQEKKVAIEGFYHKTGNIDQLYAVQMETLPSMSPPVSHIIPLLTEDSPRDIRAYFLRCSEQSPNVGCWTRIRGTVTMCSLTIFGSSVPKPCISVDGGWFLKN